MTEDREPYPSLFGDDADKAEYWRAYKESSEDLWRVFISLDIGTADKVLEHSQVKRCPQGIRQLWEDYERQREMLKERHVIPPNPPYHNEEIVFGGYDMGPIEDMFFVFNEDYQELNPPLTDPLGRKFNYEGHYIYNNNHYSKDVPMDAQSKAIWDRRRITYGEVVKRLSAMVIAPPKPGQKYFYDDFESY